MPKILRTTRLSASSITHFLMCGESYRLKYRKGYTEMVGADLVIGKAAHQVMAWINEGKMSGLKTSLKEALEYWDTIWPLHAKDCADALDRDKVLTWMSVWTSAYIKHWLPKLQPIAVEEKYEVEIGGVPLIAYIDLIAMEQDKDLGEIKRIWDFKFANRMKRSADLLEDIQMGIYSVIANTDHVGYLVGTKAKEPKFQGIRAERTPRSLQRVEALVRNVSQAIDNNAFHFTDPSSWKCTEKFCGQWHNCIQGGKRERKG